MKLKERILYTSVELFNEFGIANISPNKIAEELDISVGNLTYHYKKKSDLIEAILDIMIVKSSDYFQIKEEPTANDYEIIRLKFVKLQATFKFFFNDMVFITQKYPKVAERFKELTIERFKHSKALINLFIKNGVLKKEGKGTKYSYLLQNLWLITTFWISQEKTVGRNIEGLDNTSKEIVWSLIYPYLTEKGREQYEMYINIELN